VSLTVVARKALWGRSGNRCAYCKRDLMPTTDEATGAAFTGAGLLIGEEAHIRSGRAEGPRHDPDYENVDGYDNLVLLCPTHHTLVDKDGGAAYSVSQLEQLKRDHEEWVRSRLSAAEATALQLEVLLAADVQRMEDALFERWPGLHWMLQQPVPALRRSDLESLVGVGMWLLAKDWPSSHARIRAAADRVRTLIRLLVQHVQDAFEPVDEDGPLRLHRAEKHLGRWDPEAYEPLAHKSELNAVCAWWLAEQLAKSLNWWISAVREDLDPLYRFSEGVLLATEGDFFVSGIQHVRYEYDATQAPDPLPESLDQLRDAIERRATEIGESPQYVVPSEVRL
jgi:hypothetical protein